MKRNFSSGDAITIIGISVYLIFMLVTFILYIFLSKSFDIIGLGQVVLILFTGLPIITLVFSFTHSSDYLRYQYIFPVFVIVAKMANVSTLSPSVLYDIASRESTNAGWLYGLDFFILAGAFIVAVGTYKAQSSLDTAPKMPVVSHSTVQSLDKIEPRED